MLESGQTNRSAICNGCAVSLQHRVKERGDWGGMWRNEGGLNDGANLGLLLAGLSGQWPLKLLVLKVVSLQLCPLLQLQWHILNPSTNWFGLLKKQKATPANREIHPVFWQVNNLTWPTEESDELKPRGRRACRARRGQGRKGRRSGGCSIWHEELLHRLSCAA